jgi:hypothetical protein
MPQFDVKTTCLEVVKKFRSAAGGKTRQFTALSVDLMLARSQNSPFLTAWSPLRISV